MRLTIPITTFLLLATLVPAVSAYNIKPVQQTQGDFELLQLALSATESTSSSAQDTATDFNQSISPNANLAVPEEIVVQEEIAAPEETLEVAQLSNSEENLEVLQVAADDTQQEMIPFDNEPYVQENTESALPSEQPIIKKSSSQDWSGKVFQNIKTLLSQDNLTAEARHLTEQFGNALSEEQSVDTEELQMRYARLAGRAVADATVEEVRELPWVKTIEVKYELPVGGSGSIHTDALLTFDEIDKDGNLFFSQVGGRYKQDRFIGNFGLGFRSLSADETWLWGTNIFWDYDFMGYHLRGGVGAEIKTSILDTYFNYYLPLTEWKDAYQHPYLEERAAEGFDFGLTGRFSFLPSVTWNTKYFKWYGDTVDVYGDDKYVSNPDGVEFGLKWNPWKAINFALIHSRALGTNLQETKIVAQFSVALEEIDTIFETPNYVAGFSVRDKMDDLVYRQNEIVFERRVSAEGKALGIVITRFERK